MLTEYDSLNGKSSEITKEIADKVQKIAKHPEKVMEIFRNAKFDLLRLNGLEIFDRDVEGYIIPFLKLNPNIDELELIKNSVSDTGLNKLAQVETLFKLTLSENPIFGNQLEEVQKSKHLRVLVLDSTNVTDWSCTLLAKNTSLQYFSANKSKITENGFSTLKSSLIDTVESDFGVRNLENEEDSYAREQKTSP